jgi:hypothetical protein
MVREVCSTRLDRLNESRRAFSREAREGATRAATRDRKAGQIPLSCWLRGRVDKHVALPSPRVPCGSHIMKLANILAAVLWLISAGLWAKSALPLPLATLDTIRDELITAAWWNELAAFSACIAAFTQMIAAAISARGEK